MVVGINTQDFFFFFFFFWGGGVGVICTAFKKSLLRAWFDTSYGDNIQMVKKKKKKKKKIRVRVAFKKSLLRAWFRHWLLG